MSNSLTSEDLADKVRKKVYIQNYSKKPSIEGVRVISLASHVGEEGDLSEILRLSTQGELENVPGFKIRQINRSQLTGGAVKAWHLHLRQEEIWYVIPSGKLLVGLWDVRKNAKTSGVAMRIMMGGGNSRLLFIPKGVAHGLANFTDKPAELFYIMNQEFDPANPDEYRIPWDSNGSDFWIPKRD